jgi:hypothetical protein
MAISSMYPSISYNEVAKLSNTSPQINLTTWLSGLDTGNSSMLPSIQPTQMRWDRFHSLFDSIHQNKGLWWYNSINNIIDDTTDHVSCLINIHQMDSIFYHQVSDKIIGTNGFTYNKWGLIYVSTDTELILLQAIMIKNKIYGLVCVAKNWIDLQTVHKQFAKDFVDQMSEWEKDLN